MRRCATRPNSDLLLQAVSRPSPARCLQALPRSPPPAAYKPFRAVGRFVWFLFSVGRLLIGRLVGRLRLGRLRVGFHFERRVFLGFAVGRLLAGALVGARVGVIVVKVGRCVGFLIGTAWASAWAIGRASPAAVGKPGLRARHSICQL